MPKCNKFNENALAVTVAVTVNCNCNNYNNGWLCVSVCVAVWFVETFANSSKLQQQMPH